MSRKCIRWSKEAMEARGWRDPDMAAKNAAVAKEADRIASEPPSPPFINIPAAAQKPARAPKRASKGVREVVPYERDVLRAVLAALQAHPRVAWAVRLNSGMAMLPGRGGKTQPVRFGFEGAPDIIGQMSQVPYLRVEGQPAYGVGSFLAVEAKRPGKKATLAQAAFLLRVREAGGVGFVAHDISDVWTHLGKP